MQEINLWFSIFIPLIGVLIAYKFFKEEFEWWEYILGPIISFIFLLIFILALKSNLNSDTEYFGSIVVKARYTEYWETWVRKTCSYTTCTGSGKTRRCTTHYYDCSYCDHNPEYYTLYDNLGNSYNTSKETYLKLKKDWDNESFKDLHRNINYHFSCGKDGDAYETFYNQNVYKSLSVTNTHPYKNPTLHAYSAFKYDDIEDTNQLKKVYDYPKLQNLYQSNIIGLKVSDSINKLFQFLNGYYGSNKKARFYYLFYNDKPISNAILQQKHWKNGNQNEIVICIGIKNNQIQWCYPFGWNHNKYLYVNIKNDIQNMKYLDMYRLYNISVQNLKYFKTNDLQKEFDYLEPELPTWALYVVYIVNIFITIGCIIFGIKNKTYYY